MDNLGIPFSDFLSHIFKETIRADAEMQLLQRQAWIELNKELRLAQGLNLGEGLGQLEYLGLNEVRLTFWAEPVRPGFWSRLKRWVRSLLGKPEPVAKLMYDISSGLRAEKSGFNIAVTVSRGQDKKYTIKSEPDEKELGDVYVTRLVA